MNANHQHSIRHEDVSGWPRVTAGNEAVRAIGPENSETPLDAEILPSSGGVSARVQPTDIITLERLRCEVAKRGSSVRQYRFPASRIKVEHDRIIAGEREFRLDGAGLKRL
jgi:hypothetical protein